MTDPDPRPARAAATDPAEPVTVADIAAFTARLARLRPPALGGDPAEYAALLAHKAALFARIADQHARTDPTHAQEARGIAERAHAAARHAADTHDTTNVKDLTSPSFPGWGISLSNTGEFRRASSRVASRRIRWAMARASTQVNRCTRILWSVKWRIGAKDTTCGSLAWRNAASRYSWDR